MFSFSVMREVGKTLGIPVHVFGNETHMTAIVSMALGKKPIPKEPTVESHTANFLLPGGQNTAVSVGNFLSFFFPRAFDRVLILFIILYLVFVSACLFSCSEFVAPSYVCLVSF